MASATDSLTPTPVQPRRRARRKEARPGEIVEAALRLFADRGFAATKLEAVAPPGVVPNLEAPVALSEGPDRSAADILRAIADRFLLLLDTDLTAIPKLVVAESGNFPALARFYAEEVILKGMA